MRRASRTFKLKLSPAGVDLLLECHCMVMKAARRLLAGGMTLQAAIDYLDSLPTLDLANRLENLPQAGLVGDVVFFFYAPTAVKDVAIRIAHRIKEVTPERTFPALAHIYVLAIQQLVKADRQTLRDLCWQVLME
jgi:hypothetical protein